MTRRLLLIFSLLIAVMAFSPAVAQDDALLIYCGDLTGEDCQVLRDASAVSNATTSGSFITQFYTAVSNPEVPTDVADVTFAVTVEGDYGRDIVATSSDLTAQSSAARTVDSIRGLSFQGIVSALAAEEQTADTAGDSEVDQPMREVFYGEVVLSDGILYVNRDSLRLAAEQDLPGDDLPTRPSGWVSTDLVGLLGLLIAADNNTMSTNMMTAYQTGPEMRGWFNRAEYADHIEVTIADLEDEALIEYFGQDVAVYTTVFDVGGFVNDPNNRALLTEQMAANAAATAGNGAGDVAQSDFEARTESLNDAQIRFVEYVGLDDSLIHRNEVIINNLAMTDDQGASRRADLVLITEFYDFDLIEMAPVPVETVDVPPLVFLQEIYTAITNDDSDMSGFGILTPDNLTDAGPADEVIPELPEATEAATTDMDAGLSETATPEVDDNVTIEVDTDLIVPLEEEDAEATIVPLVVEPEATEVLGE